MDFSSLLSLVRCIFPNFTDRTLDVLSAAHQHATAGNHIHVAPEHVLLAIAKVERGVGCLALDRLGVNLRDEIGKLETLVRDAPPRAHGEHCASFSPETELLLATATSESKALGHDYVGTEHLVLGLLNCGRSPASEYLQRSGITSAQVRDEIRTIFAARDGLSRGE